MHVEGGGMLFPKPSIEVQDIRILALYFTNNLIFLSSLVCIVLGQSLIFYIGGENCTSCQMHEKIFLKIFIFQTKSLFICKKNNQINEQIQYSFTNMLTRVVSMVKKKLLHEKKKRIL